MSVLTENRVIAFGALAALCIAPVRIPQLLAQHEHIDSHHQQRPAHMEDKDFIAEMQRRLPEVPKRPPAIVHNNQDIDAIAASAREAEDAGQLPRTDYGRYAAKAVEK